MNKLFSAIEDSFLTFAKWVLHNIRFVLIFVAFTDVVGMVRDPGPVVTPLGAGLAIFWVVLSLWISDDLSV